MSDVLIIGGGISGLILAQHLREQGVSFRIFESDSALDARKGGWGLTLHWCLPALRELLPESLLDRFPETFVNKEASMRGETGSFRFFNLQTGDALFDSPATERIRVNRGRMRELLTQDLAIEWNKTLHSIESPGDSVTACFDDGSSYTGRLLVACDGARSRTRQILYPDSRMTPLPVQLLGASALYTGEEMGGAQSIDPYIFQGSHPETDVFLFFSFLDTPNNFDESSKDAYHCQIIISWADSKGITLPTSNADRIALMKQLSDNWAEPFRGLVQKLPIDSEARSIRIEDWMFRLGRTHAHPRVVLAGDSAHTMTMCKSEDWESRVPELTVFSPRRRCQQCDCGCARSREKSRHAECRVRVSVFIKTATNFAIDHSPRTCCRPPSTHTRRTFLLAWNRASWHRDKLASMPTTFLELREVR